MTDSPYNGMSAVLYARVSTDDKGQTTESQIREMKKWCEDNGVNILGIYKEEESAKDMDRHELDSVLGRIARGGVNILLAWSESRISRNTKDMEQIVDYVSKYGTVIRYVTSSSIAPEEDGGQLLNNINTWQAQVERKKLSVNTKNGMLTAKLNGVHCGRMLAFCFSHRVEECKSMIKTDDSAKRKTVIMSLDSVMDLARIGYTINYAAHNIVHVDPKTLRHALEREGVYDEYQNLVSKARILKEQGVAGTRVGNTPEIAGTRGEVE